MEAERFLVGLQVYPLIVDVNIIRLINRLIAGQMWLPSTQAVSWKAVRTAEATEVVDVKDVRINP